MRELKKAVESYWKGNSSQDELLKTAADLRHIHWQTQKDAGVDYIPSNDFAFYDQMLDMCALLGAVPARYNWDGGNVDLDTYFSMARGNATVTAMEMTKWFDTNYHYIVPEFEKGMSFKISSTKVFDQFAESKEAGFETHPVLVGPVSFTHLGKGQYEGYDPHNIMMELLPVYVEILKKLESQGATWVQMDEPFLAMDVCDTTRAHYGKLYEALRQEVPGVNLMVTTYFEGLRENLQTAVNLPVGCLHVDLCRAPEQLDDVLAAIKDKDMALSLGVVDGRNIWRNDLDKSLSTVEKAVAALGADRVLVGPSCSLLHSPVDLSVEAKMDDEIKSWMSFATQKLSEIATIAKGATEGRDAIASELADSNAVVEVRKTSTRIHDQAVKARMAAITSEMADRDSEFSNRVKAQQENLNLPLYPTTTIGSFPQTKEIRKARADFKKGELSLEAYEDLMEKEVEMVVRYQEDIDMDVLVHGEPERNDMVEYFGEQLEGYVFSQYGWVQSYGSRCVKPPIIFGDVSRPKPMTVRWSAYAQSLTDRVMKGMLTGPITILQWSFVRDDQPRKDTCYQIALAIRDEVADLEKAGIKAIQIDEPAIREGLPLRRADWDEYLDWAVTSFRLSAACVEDKTQIHTHMCYSEFNDIMPSIAALDADVLSIETSRSQMELLDAFVDFKYPNEIGPGVYDIHSPRIPAKQEMVDLLDKAAALLPENLIWVNPDCGLKTRGWAEVKPALEYMVEAAKEMRAKSKAQRAA
jgi:5-methyltetrahydropteroyltriglutamate--homocysteine methyltransferase